MSSPTYASGSRSAELRIVNALKTLAVVIFPLAASRATLLRTAVAITGVVAAGLILF